MLLDLHGLPDDYSRVRAQILGSPVVPNFPSTCSTLLSVSSKHITYTTFILNCFLYFNLFIAKLKINFEFQFEPYTVIMLVSIFLILLPLL